MKDQRSEWKSEVETGGLCMHGMRYTGPGGGWGSGHPREILKEAAQNINKILWSAQQLMHRVLALWFPALLFVNQACL